MGANDDREMLEVAKEECIRLELENAELLAMYQRLIEGRSAAWADLDAAIARAEDAERERDALAAATVALEAVKAEAWEEGANAATRLSSGDGLGMKIVAVNPRPANPYRKTGTEKR